MHRSQKRLFREWALIEAKLRELLPDTPEIIIEVTPDVRLEPRNYADVTMDSDPIELRVHPDLLDAPITMIRGVLTHEAGHVADSQLNAAQVWALTGFDGDDEEIRADVLGEWVTGWRVRYSLEDDVQRAGPGARGASRRPPWL